MTWASQKSSGRHFGADGEAAAAAFLADRGVMILQKNYRVRFGEIDLVGLDGKYLVFFEVKRRNSEKWGLPEEAVGRKKQATIRRVAAHYLMAHGYGEDAPCRFDVIGILGNEIIWIKDAF